MTCEPWDCKRYKATGCNHRKVATDEMRSFQSDVMQFRGGKVHRYTVCTMKLYTKIHTPYSLPEQLLNCKILWRFCSSALWPTALFSIHPSSHPGTLHPPSHPVFNLSSLVQVTESTEECRPLSHPSPLLYFSTFTQTASLLCRLLLYGDLQSTLQSASHCQWICFGPFVETSSWSTTL